MTDTNSGSATETLVIACPVDGALNRVPRARLDDKPKCGTCHSPLFQGKAINLTDASFDAYALKSDLPLVIDFWASWCQPCRVMSPNFEAAATRLEPRVRMAKLDVDAANATAERYRISGIPSLVMIHKGREIERTSGAMPTEAIVSWVERALLRV